MLVRCQRETNLYTLPVGGVCKCGRLQWKLGWRFLKIFKNRNNHLIELYKLRYTQERFCVGTQQRYLVHLPRYGTSLVPSSQWMDKDNVDIPMMDIYTLIPLYRGIRFWHLQGSGWNWTPFIEKQIRQKVFFSYIKSSHIIYIYVLYIKLCIWKNYEKGEVS